MSEVLRGALVVLQKDLRIELRTGEVVITTGLFGALVTVMASLSFYLDPSLSRRIAPGVLWITIAFVGVLGMGRTWAREREQDVMRALLASPIPRAALYLGKAAGALTFTLAVELVLVPLVAILFGLDLGERLGVLTLILLLGTIGFVATGTLFSALGVKTRARDLMLSVVIFPLIAPALLSSVVATREVFAGASLPEILGWLRILAAFDLITLVAGVTLFDRLISD